MKAKDLIEILEKRPDAEVLVIAGKDKRTFVVEETANVMAHTVFLIADKTPFEYDESKKAL
jgi:uncharacterized protein YlzI (FlbEa/FlbD family)